MKNNYQVGGRNGFLRSALVGFVGGGIAMLMDVGGTSEHKVIHSFIHPFIHSFIHPSIHSFIHSFIHPFIHLLGNYGLLRRLIR
jgi:hypothetical protein